MKQVRNLHGNALPISEVAKRLNHTSVRNLRRYISRLAQNTDGLLQTYGQGNGSRILVNWGRLRTVAPHLFDLPAEIDGIRRKVDLCVEVGEELKGQNMAISTRIKALHARINDQDKAIERLKRKP